MICLTRFSYRLWDPRLFAGGLPIVQRMQPEHLVLTADISLAQPAQRRQRLWPLFEQRHRKSALRDSGIPGRWLHELRRQSSCQRGA